MIDVLNKTVEGRPQEQQEKRSYDPLPEGEYQVKVVAIDEWKPTTKDVWVNRRGEDGKIIKDADGKLVKELHKNLTFYNLELTLEVLSGEHEGRRIWTSLTTHPNAEFITQGFLYAIGATKMTYGEIPENCLEKVLNVTTFNESYKKTVVDKDTGLENEVEKFSTRVKYFSRPSIIEPGVSTEDV